MSIHISCPHCRRPYRLKDKFSGKCVKCRDCAKEFQVPAASAPPAELSEAGDPIYRHQQPATDGELVFEPTPFAEAIERHVRRTVGPFDDVFHELLSTDIHLDLLVVPPSGVEPSESHPLGGKHWTIVTSGMSSRPMSLPAGVSTQQRYAELMVSLPAEWPGLREGGFDSAAMDDEDNWWPIRWLKNLARLPHMYQTFLAPGHTVPSDDPPEPYSSRTRQCCMLVWPSLLQPDSAKLMINDDICINFYALWPIYPEEMNAKLKKGTGVLLEKFDALELYDLIQENRKNTCRRWPF